MSSGRALKTNGFSYGNRGRVIAAVREYDGKTRLFGCYGSQNLLGRDVLPVCGECVVGPGGVFLVETVSCEVKKQDVVFHIGQSVEPVRDVDGGGGVFLKFGDAQLDMCLLFDKAKKVVHVFEIGLSLVADTGEGGVVAHEQGVNGPVGFFFYSLI